MLAEEAFSDHPSCACPVISTLLRTYNDRLDDEQRQRLYPLAALVVGTRGSHSTAQLRYQALLGWCDARNASLPRWRRWMRRARVEESPKSLVDLSLLTLRCLPRRFGERTHAQFVELVEQLVALRAPEPAQAPERARVLASA